VSFEPMGPWISRTGTANYPYLSTEGFKVASVEVLREDRFGEGIGGVQDQQSAPPFDHAAVLFFDQHVVQAPDELVQP
jgi:hypothetical protein